MAHVEHGFQPPAERCRDPNNPGGRGGGGGGGGGGRRLAAHRPNPDYSDMTKLGAGMYRSEDGGATWMFLDRYISRPFYYMHVAISPLDDKYIFSFNINYRRSMDGGKTWVGTGAPQGGHCYHAMWHDPHNKDRYYIGSDGGLNLTHDDGESVAAVQQHQRDAVLRRRRRQCASRTGSAAACRTPAARAARRRRARSAIYTSDWFNLSGGDGYHAEIDPDDWRIVYTESQPDVNGGNVGRSNVETMERQSIAAEQEQHLELDAVHHAGDGRAGVQEQLGPPAAADGPAPLQLVDAAASCRRTTTRRCTSARITC